MLLWQCRGWPRRLLQSCCLLVPWASALRVDEELSENLETHPAKKIRSHHNDHGWTARVEAAAAAECLVVPTPAPPRAKEEETAPAPKPTPGPTRPAEAVCYWDGAAPFCQGGPCRDGFAKVTTSLEGDGKKCWTGEKWHCCKAACHGKFSDWSTCSRSCGGGRQTRRFTIISPQIGHDPEDACPLSVEERECNEHPCPVNCLGEWGDWAGCTLSCGSGSRSRAVVVKRPAAHGGLHCVRAKIEDCNTEPCPVDCEGTWDSWTPCSTTCGPGIQKKIFHVGTSGSNGGMACPESLQQTCFARACPSPEAAQKTEEEELEEDGLNTTPYQAVDRDAQVVDCKGRWGPWSACKPSSSKTADAIQEQTSEFLVTKEAMGGGKACPTTRSRPCIRHFADHCYWSGTAPMCKPERCLPGYKDTNESSISGDGSKCEIGFKIKCCGVDTWRPRPG